MTDLTATCPECGCKLRIAVSQGPETAKSMAERRGTAPEKKFTIKDPTAPASDAQLRYAKKIWENLGEDPDDPAPTRGTKQQLSNWITNHGG